ncbi:MAG: PQQ-dependent sugar dehydrogenase [Gammaproteobacteria bacterium]
MHRAFQLLVSIIAFAATLAISEPLLDPLPEPIERGSQETKLRVIADGMVSPVHATHAPGDRNRIFVADQQGIAYAIDLATGTKTVFLDIVERTLTTGGYDEKGLLGLAFHPRFWINGLFYTYTSETPEGDADFPWDSPFTFGLHQSVINEWRVDNPLNPAALPDANSPREIMRIDQPTGFHNGGALVFDRRGNLLIALGNGGPLETGQDNSSVLGSILRIIPNANYAPYGNHYPSSNGQYLIPESNPFNSDAEAHDEIYAHGFRHPYRISVDRRTNEIYAGDVGNNDIEEVDLVTAGENYGFPIKEGSFCFTGSGGPPDGSPGVEDPSTCTEAAAGLTDPLAEYDHDEGVAVIGGYVYRGRAMRWRLGGTYIFGDFNGRLFYLDGETIRELGLSGQDSLGGALLGMGEDTRGELYLLVNDTGRAFGTSGRLIKLDPLQSDLDERQRRLEMWREWWRNLRWWQWRDWHSSWNDPAGR